MAGTNTLKELLPFALSLCVCVCVCARTPMRMLVAQSCLILCDPIDYSLPVSSVYGILQVRILERVAISFSRGSSQPRGQN